MEMKKTAFMLMMIASLTLTAACSSRGVVDGTVNTAGFVAKTAVNGTIGAGKLVGRAVTGGED